MCFSAPSKTPEQTEAQGEQEKAPSPVQAEKTDDGQDGGGNQETTEEAPAESEQAQEPAESGNQEETQEES